MEQSKDLGWIVDALIDINAYCEREGLVDISEHLIQTIESVAPIIHNQPFAGPPQELAPERIRLCSLLEQRR